MDLQLTGRTALITGASQGMGRAIATTLANEGVKVFATARNEALLNSLKSAYGIETFIQEFKAPDAPQKIAQAALDALGPIDILINNTGRSQPMGVIGSEEDWESSLTLDFTRHRQLTQAILPAMMERKQGVILNITSTYELRFINGSAVAKAAIAAWSKQLAGQLGAYNIRVNCLQPGLIDTENIRRLFNAEERKLFAEREIPLGDFGEAQDIANMAAFLVSPMAKYVTGSVTAVDGGLRRYAF